MTNRKDIFDNMVEYSGDYFERVIFKPFAGTSERVPVIKLDDVYIYFPTNGEIIISKEDINTF